MIGEPLLGIEEGGRPHLQRVELLDAQDVGLVVVVEVEVGGVELTVVQDDENLVISVELT